MKKRHCLMLLVLLAGLTACSIEDDEMINVPVYESDALYGDSWGVWSLDGEVLCTSQLHWGELLRFSAFPYAELAVRMVPALQGHVGSVVYSQDYDGSALAFKIRSLGYSETSDYFALNNGLEGGEQAGALIVADDGARHTLTFRLLSDNSSVQMGRDRGDVVIALALRQPTLTLQGGEVVRSADVVLTFTATKY